MKFEFKQTKVPSRVSKRLPNEVTFPRAYKVRCDGAVLGLVVGSDLAGKPGWGYYKDGDWHGGKRTRQMAAEALASS